MWVLNYNFKWKTQHQEKPLEIHSPVKVAGCHSDSQPLLRHQDHPEDEITLKKKDSKGSRVWKRDRFSQKRARKLLAIALQANAQVSFVSMHWFSYFLFLPFFSNRDGKTAEEHVGISFCRPFLRFVAHQSRDCSCFKGFTRRLWNVTPARFLARGRSLHQFNCTAAQRGSSFVSPWRLEPPLFKFLPLLECSHKTPAERHSDGFRNIVVMVTLYSLIHLMIFLTVQHCTNIWSQRWGFHFFMTPNIHLDNMDSPAQGTHTHTRTHRGAKQLLRMRLWILHPECACRCVYRIRGISQVPVFLKSCSEDGGGGVRR